VTAADLATTADIDRVLAVVVALRADLAEVRASLPPRMISLADAARALAVDVQTARAMCDRHELTWRRCGRRIVVDAASLRPSDPETVARLSREARS
jgi:hypothetical protein